jgi:hypothetical protein
VGFGTFSMQVDASVETLWALLADKVENPQAYTGAVESVTFSERDGARLVRAMKTLAGDVVERIHVDAEALRIESEFLEHDKYRGTTVKKIVPDPDGGRPTLTITLDWEVIDGSGDEDATPFAMAGVRHTAQLAEQREAST